MAAIKIESALSSVVRNNIYATIVAFYVVVFCVI